MEKKAMTIANFNVVFGKDEEPLLNYFDSILMPALKAAITRTIHDTDYLLMDVEVIEASNDNYAIKGIIVKKTVLEIKTKFNENDTELVETNELHPTAPYSTFVIFLKNHRMVLVKNQKGSPDLRSFSATVRFILDRYIRDENLKRKSNNEQLLPYALINVIGIPIRESIEEAIKKVKKINKLTMRFYPLNGDIDFSGMFNTLTTDLRKKVGSKTGSTTLNSPTSLTGITEVLTAAQGTIEPIFKVTYPDKKRGTIYNGELSENMEIAVKNEDILQDTLSITDQAKDLENITHTSDDNLSIYNKQKCKVIPFIKKNS